MFTLKDSNMSSNAWLMFELMISLLCIADAASKDSCNKQITNKGREFVFGVMKGYNSRSLSLLITAGQNGSVEMTAPRLGPVPTIHQLTKDSTEIPLDKSVVAVEGITANGIRLVADTDIQVTIQMKRGATDEIILVLPIQALSTAYSVVSAQGYSGRRATILIAAPFNDTDVHIQFAENSETEMNITLNETQTYQHYTANNSYDLTGTMLTSSKPIYVVAGSEFAPIPFGEDNNNYVADTMLPRHTWDNMYIVPPNPPQQAYMVKIVHGDTDTTITMSNNSYTLNTTLRDTHHVDFISGMDPLVVRSDVPVMVAKFGTSYNFWSQNIGDPFLTVVPGVNQYLDNYEFIVPTFHYDNFSNYLAITVPSSSESELMLDGGPVKAIYRFPVSKPLDDYTVLVTSVPEGLHHIYSRDNTTFGALLYGFDTHLSYGGSVGLALKRTGNSACNVSTTVQSHVSPTVLSHVSSTVSSHVSSTVPSLVSTTVPSHVSTTVPSHVSSTVSSHVSTTVQSHVSSTVQSHVSLTVPSKQCVACTDMTDPGLCDHVQQCTSSQVCYVERYTLSSGDIRFRSGCRDQNTCSGSSTHSKDTCIECCSGDRCNVRGCGIGAPPRDQRGPFCFECAHVNDTDFCHHVTLCAPDQVCGIEKYSWGGVSYNYILGCQYPGNCSSRRRETRLMPDRSSLICHTCCTGDFCNYDCQPPSRPNVIG